MNTNSPPDGSGLLGAVLRQLAGGVQIRPPWPVHQKLPSAGTPCPGDSGLSYGRTRRDEE